MDKIKPLDIVSVILPSFNSEKTILRAVNSVLKQEGLNEIFTLQLIVVDDCSTDSTLEFLNKISNIEVYSNTVNSGGPNKGRNVGLSKAIGNYIMFIDHDDEWLPNKVLEQLKLKQFPVVTCGFNVIYPIKNKISVGITKEKNPLKFDKNHSFLMLLIREKIAQNTYFGTLMIHSSLKNIRFEEKYGVCDYDYILKILHSQTSAQVAKPLFNRYSDGKNLSYNENYRIKDYKIALDTYNNFLEDYPKEVYKGKLRLNAAMARYYIVKSDYENALKFLEISRKGPLNLLFKILIHFNLIKYFNFRLFNF